MNIFITSGYFNPIHEGHCALFSDVNKLKSDKDQFVVIVNNDAQQRLKKGKIIMNENARVKVVESIKGVDLVYLSIDTDGTICESLRGLKELINSSQKDKPNLWFCKGGDRSSVENVPEFFVCRELGINVLFGVGGFDKKNSSSDINKRRGAE